MLSSLSGRSTLRVKLLLASFAGLLVPVAPVVAVAVYQTPVEEYADYQPQTRCRTTVRPGTKELSRWIDAKFAGGDAIPSLRRCKVGGTSEHKEGRAIDWMMNASKQAHRQEVRRFLTRLFAEDADGNHAALARRMGVMYVIWNDHMYASYDRFSKRAYTPCTPVRRCSKTARHRDHVHISLSRAGGKGLTSWYHERG